MISILTDLQIMHHPTSHEQASLCCRHILKLEGPGDNVQKAKQAVEDMDLALQAAGQKAAGHDEDSIDCAACFCPIDDKDLYRLEACGHPFCLGCITHQVGFTERLC